jgi:thiol-disulfide isomerase/thioredoxin
VTTEPATQGERSRQVCRALSGVVLAAALLGTWPAWAVEPGQGMPELTHTRASEWINSSPLSLEALRGKVVLIDFWTFDCWNCYRSFPWLNALEGSLAEEPFMVIGVHTPEFDHERDRERIVEQVRRFDLHHPIMVDNDYSYWNAVRNRYWPAFYVIDRAGVLRGRFVGETHAGERRARAIEALIRSLLPAPGQ